MKVLVCGGRDFEDWEATEALDHIHYKETKIELIIQGGADGGDQLAKDWAYMNGVPCLEHPADWYRLGKSAGVIRNKEMLKWEPDLVVAFPGGKGTANMVQIAKKAGIPVREVTIDD